LLDRLADGDVVVADGATGTMLRAHGLKADECPELVTLEHPDWLEEIASAYLEAGAEIIQTNTFGASPPRLTGYRLDHLTEELNRTAVEIARRVAGSRAYVAASCGPTGLALDRCAAAPATEIGAAFERQLKAILTAGVDLILFETMSDLTEATVAIETARSLAPDMPIIVSMTFESLVDGYKTFRGVSVAPACRRLTESGANAMGSNCGEGSASMVEIARIFRANSELPLIMQPNAGLPLAVDGRLTYPETPELMAKNMKAMLDIGVQIIGGCCGTTPDHIRALRRLTDQRKNR